MIRLIDVIEWRLSNFLESEYEFSRYLGSSQLHNLIQICTPGCLDDGACLRNQTDTIYLNNINNNTVLHSCIPDYISL